MPKNNLQNFQIKFVDFINQGSEDEDLLKSIVPAGKLSNPYEALNIHKNGYFAKLTESLGETFEGTWFVMGDELFFNICREFIKKNNSTVYDLSEYGNNFPEFLQNLEDMKDIPFVQDMARFDWIFKDLFHEEQHNPLSVGQLKKIEINMDLSFKFGNAVKLFSSAFPVYKIWNLRNEKKPNISKIDMEKGENLILYKVEDEIFVKELPSHQYKIILSFFSGQTISTVLDTATIDIQNDIINVFETMGALGIVVDVL